MIADDIVAAIRARLARALAPPPGRTRRCGSATTSSAGSTTRARRGSPPFADVFDVRRRRHPASPPALASPDARTARAATASPRRWPPTAQLTAWRNERYAVAAGIRRPAVVSARARGGAVLRHSHLRGARERARPARRRHADVDRAAQPRARRSIPGLLDNLVGGGIAAGTTVAAHRDQGSVGGSRHRRAARARARRPRAPCTSAARSRTACSARRSSSTTSGCPPISRPPARTAKSSSTVWSRSPRGRAARRQRPAVPTSSPPTASLVIVDCLMRHGAIAPDSPDYRRAGGAAPSAAPDAGVNAPRGAAAPRASQRRSLRRGAQHRGLRRVDLPDPHLAQRCRRIALTACRISSGPMAPMQPTRNVSTCVSLPG